MSGAESLHRLFPGTAYRMAMDLRPLAVRDYFRAQHGDAVLALRRELLRSEPGHYLAELPEAAEGVRLAEKCLDASGGWRFLGEHFEPDLVLLHNAGDGCFRVVAGCVCFPTVWSLPEKMGRPLAEVHTPVPDLNAQLASRIDQFLLRLGPGTAYGRANWGLCATDQLDQHPRHRLPAIPSNAELSEVWLRVEDQALVGLGESFVLFGIRVSHHRLDSLIADRDLVEKMAVALETMPPALTDYKRLSDCRSELIAKLRE